MFSLYSVFALFLASKTMVANFLVIGFVLSAFCLQRNTDDLNFYMKLEVKLWNPPSPLLWTAFSISVFVALAIDFYGLNKNSQQTVSFKSAAIWSLVWFSLALAFGGLLWWKTPLPIA